MKILFVCSANTCRSPMAMYIAQKLAPGHIYDSAGSYAIGGNPATENAISTVENYNPQIRSHVSKHVREVKLDEYDAIVCMTIENAMSLMDSPLTKFLRWCKILPRAKHLPIIVWDIPDPYGLAPFAYKYVGEVLASHIYYFFGDNVENSSQQSPPPEAQLH